MNILRSNERGFADHGWLRSFHTFSFADYYDPRRMGFFALRVINEDRVAAGQGFPRHGHRDMEILSYVLEGALAHKDSMGTGAVIQPGDVQRMSAGTGVMHSEYNGSTSEEVHFLQIWVVPAARGNTPGYEQKRYTDAQKRGKLCLVASPDGRDGSVTVRQDLLLYATLLDGAEAVTHTLGPDHAAWIHVARGEVTVDGERLTAGDAAAIGSTPNGGGTIQLAGGVGAEVLLFDVKSN